MYLEIEAFFVVPFRYAPLFDAVCRGTRRRPVSSVPRGVLFEGPPGTGKTTCARVLAAQCDAPLVNFRMETVVGKWYGESERTLGRIFDLCRELGPAVLLFVDELDSVTPTRSSDRGEGARARDRIQLTALTRPCTPPEVNETTRRLLSILLRNLDGFDPKAKARGKIVLLGATNRVGDLDAAVMSRFDIVVRFGLPDAAARAAIFACFAKQLPQADLEALAGATEGFSGRDIHDVCGAAERAFVSRLVAECVAEGRAVPAPAGEQGEPGAGAGSGVGLPSLEDYLAAVGRRRFRGEPRSCRDLKICMISLCRNIRYCDVDADT
eukprot:tig00000215_g18581.t1